MNDDLYSSQIDDDLFDDSPVNASTTQATVDNKNNGQMVSQIL